MAQFSGSTDLTEISESEINEIFSNAYNKVFGN